MSTNTTAPMSLPTRLPVVWLFGAPGTGKSVTAWASYQALADHQVAHVDIDQLTMLFPGSDERAKSQLAADNLAALARIHQLAGTEALLVSGVLEPDHRPLFEQALAEVADLIWVHMDASDEVVRERVGARGWPSELVDQAVAEAESLRTQNFAAATIDSSSAPLDDATQRLLDLVTLREPQPAAALPRSRPGALACLFGARAVGLSSVSWELFMRRAGGGAPTGYLDADQLAFVHADEALRNQLQLAAITALARNFTVAGATLTIVNGHLQKSVRDGLHEVGAQLVRIDADADQVRRNIAERHGGSAARLAGDDLIGASSEHQAAVLADSVAEAEQLRDQGGRVHVLAASGRPVTELVDQLSPLLDMSRTEPLDERHHADPPSHGIDHGACCVIITGSPAAGKSTITRALAERLERSAWLNGDQVHWVIVGGRVWSLGEPKDEADRQTRLGNRNLCSLATNCAAAGFTPVIDWIIPDAAQLDAMVADLDPLPVWLVVLDPGQQACTVRNLQREDQFAFDGYDQLIGGMRREFGHRAWWLDSSEQTAEQTLDTIWQRAQAVGRG